MVFRRGAQIATALAMLAAAPSAQATGILRPVRNPLVGIGIGNLDFSIGLAPALLCSDGRPVAVTLTLGDRTKTVTDRFSDPCAGKWVKQRDNGFSADWGNFQTDGDPRLVDTPSDPGQGPYASFLPVWTGKRRFFYRVSMPNGTIIAQQTLAASVIPDKRIYQGTDAFVNYCINGAHPIRSLHLRLYCTKPGLTTFYHFG